MIAYLVGIVHDFKPSHVILLVNGVGYAVSVPKSYSPVLGEQLALEIYTHVTQDQGMSLFGFATQSEKEVFMQIISCSGIGPRIGLAVLAQLDPSAFVAAIMTGDARTLSSVDGIGLKKAEGMIVQLKDKVGKISLNNAGKAHYQAATVVKQLNEVLLSLGYNRHEINYAIDQLKHQELLNNQSFDQLLRSSLGYLAKKAL